MKTLPLLVLLVLLTSGCIQLRIKEKDPITWGLGLDVEGKPLPEPGPFAEGHENVTALGKTLNVTLARVIQNCGASSSGERETRSALAANNLLFAIEAALDACEGDWGSAARELARSASTEQERLQLYLDTRARAVAALDEEAATLSLLPPPGTVIDAEVQGLLMYRVAFHAYTVTHTAPLSFEAFNQTHADIDWANVFTNLVGPIRSVNSTKDFAAHYPLASGNCDVPEFASVKEKVGLMIARLLEQQQGDARNLTLATQRDFQYYSGHHWTLGLLTIVRGLSLDLAVLDTYKSSTLPTRTEAQFLFAESQHSDRRLGSEWWASDFRQQLEDKLPWEKYHEKQAREVLALPQMEPAALSRLHCTPGRASSTTDS